MREINLLPWRSIKKQKLKKKYLFFAIACLIIVGKILWGINKHIESKIINQFHRNKQLEKKIKRTNAQLKALVRLKNIKMDRINRLKEINRARKEAIKIIHLLYDLEKIIPNNIKLIKIEKKEKTMECLGYAVFQRDVSVFLQNFKKIKGKFKVDLLEIKTQNLSHKMNKFKISIGIKE